MYCYCSTTNYSTNCSISKKTKKSWMNCYNYYCSTKMKKKNSNCVNCSNCLTKNCWKKTN